MEHQHRAFNPPPPDGPPGPGQLYALNPINTNPNPNHFHPSSSPTTIILRTRAKHRRTALQIFVVGYVANAQKKREGIYKLAPKRIDSSAVISAIDSDGFEGLVKVNLERVIKTVLSWTPGRDKNQEE
ncbi:unnamed protein product [Allacma fusca]|uniref:Uncharacterized protein n=1 Tax=Allacma fusca TaxID=39272 RepID=A0A8J2NSH6_9HEXA|nr:unnamed protein product [Allacma fusca]